MLRKIIEIFGAKGSGDEMGEGFEYQLDHIMILIGLAAPHWSRLYCSEYITYILTYRYPGSLISISPILL